MFYQLKHTARRLFRAKTYTIINITGIVLGFTISSLLLLYAKKEWQSDNFFPQLENIYRIQTPNHYSVSNPMVQTIQQNVPEIKHITHYHGSWSRQDIIEYKGRDYELKNSFYTDSSFFSVFQYDCIYGNLKKSLRNVGEIVITKSEAQKIFGNINPVGEQVLVKTSGFGISPHTVSAVIEDIPVNSSIRFDVAFSLETLETIDWYSYDIKDWGTQSYASFVLLKPNTNPQDVGAKINSAIKTHAPTHMKNREFYLNPFKGLHFRARHGDGVFHVDNKLLVNVLAGIGLLILLIACVNYFNLSIARLQENKKEIGIRKTIGAHGHHLFLPSLFETLVFFLLAGSISFILFVLILPYFNQITHSHFTISEIMSGGNIITLICFLFFSFILFAIFPALYTNRHTAIDALRDKKSLNWRSIAIRNGLIIFQFGISIVLIICTIMLNKQSRYMIKANYGYQTKNIAYIPLSPESLAKKDFLENEYENLAHLDNVAFASNVFGQIGGNWGRTLYTNNERKSISFNVMFICPEFIDLMGLNLIEGEGFTETTANKNHVIFNETLIKKYEIQDPLFARIDQNRRSGNVVGVVEDFNYNSFHETIGALGFIGQESGADIMYVKFHNSSAENIYATLNEMEEIWGTVSPNYPFEYHFLEKQFESTYSEELYMTNLLTIASVLSIGIAILGLIGMASFVLTRRIKEIGVRRVNGAKVYQIITLLNKNFVLKVFFAFLIACPTSFLIINKWMQYYAYQTNVSWWIYLTGGFLTLIISILSISWLTFKTATINPVHTFRYE